MTRREAADLAERAREEVRRAAESADDAELSTRDAENREVHWALKSMLEAAGQRPELADANATAFTAMLSVMGQRANLSTKALWDAFAPAVRVGEDGRIYRPGDALWPSARPVSQEQGATGEAASAGSGNALAQELGIRPESEAEVRSRYEGTDQWMKAPNGKPTNLTERQWVQVRTPEFKAWFGDWEAAARRDAQVSTLKRWMTKENFDAANGHSKSEIEALFGNGLEEIGSIPEPLLALFRGKASDNAVYSGRAYMLDHAVNHHKEAPLEWYPSIPDILEEPDEVFWEENASRDSLTFVKSYEKNRSVSVSLVANGDGKIVLHKTLNGTKEKPHIQRNGVRFEVSPGGGRSPISRNGNPLPGGLLSALGKAILDKKLFGDKSVSRIVDGNGEPLVVYHGTRADDEFDVFRSGHFAGGENGRDTANAFATDPDLDKGGGRPRVYGCFLNIRNPYDTGSNGGAYRDRLALTDEMVADGVPYDGDKDFTGDDGVTHHYGTLNDIVSWARGKGYDGVVAPSVYENDGQYGAGEVDDYVPFFPTQIKSATDNVGTFDPEDPSILHQAAVTPEELRASLEEATEDVAPEDRRFLLRSFGVGPEAETAVRNRLGIPDERVTRMLGPITQEDLENSLSELAGQDLENLIEGEIAQVNANQKRKLSSSKARGKSKDNGFSGKEHDSIASQIRKVWMWSALARTDADTKNGIPDVGIRRYVAPLDIDGKDAFAWVTVKESPVGLRIYSVELMGEEKLRGTLGNGPAEAGTNTPSGRSFDGIIEKLRRPVNDNSSIRTRVDVPREDQAFVYDTFGASASEAAADDAAYLDAVRRGDMETAREMVRRKAEEKGFADAIPEQTAAYRIRTGAAPKRTLKVYKVFTMAPDGSPTALFVAGAEKLPQGVWLDAMDTWHFTAANGHAYIPSTQNPFTKGGKTGVSMEIPNEEVRRELIARGYLPEGSRAKSVTALAYRPGWHAGTMPFFPQGARRRRGRPTATSTGRTRWCSNARWPTTTTTRRRRRTSRRPATRTGR